MKIAAVVIDGWKLPIFTKHLQDAGYKFETISGITNDTLTLKVEYEWVAKLQPIVVAAEKACQISKGN